MSEWKVLNTDEVLPKETSSVFEEIFTAMKDQEDAVVGSMASDEDEANLASVGFTDPETGSTYGIAIVLYPEGRHDIGVCKRS